MIYTTHVFYNQVQNKKSVFYMNVAIDSLNKSMKVISDMEVDFSYRQVVFLLQKSKIILKCPTKRLVVTFA